MINIVIGVINIFIIIFKSFSSTFIEIFFKLSKYKYWANNDIRTISINWYKKYIKYFSFNKILLLFLENTFRVDTKNTKVTAGIELSMLEWIIFKLNTFENNKYNVKSINHPIPDKNKKFINC